MNITIGRSITSSTFFREADRAICIFKTRATLRGVRPVRGDSPAGGHVNASLMLVFFTSTIRTSVLAVSPPEPLYLSLHRVVGATDRLCDNESGRESARKPIGSPE